LGGTTATTYSYRGVTSTAIQEFCTIPVIRKRSAIPVLEIFAYEPTDDNPVGVAFMIMEFVPADTAMDAMFTRVKFLSVSRGNFMPQWLKYRYVAND
jgi:hypothetical protein